MLGLETWFDSPYPLYTFTFDDCSDTYTEDWYQQAIVELIRAKVLDMIIPTVTFPEDVIRKYIG